MTCLRACMSVSFFCYYYYYSFVSGMLFFCYSFSFSSFCYSSYLHAFQWQADDEQGDSESARVEKDAKFPHPEPQNSGTDFSLMSTCFFLFVYVY